MEGRFTQSQMELILAGTAARQAADSTLQEIQDNSLEEEYYTLDDIMRIAEEVGADPQAVVKFVTTRFPSLDQEEVTGDRLETYLSTDAIHRFHGSRLLQALQRASILEDFRLEPHRGEFGPSYLSVAVPNGRRKVQWNRLAALRVHSQPPPIRGDVVSLVYNDPFFIEACSGVIEIDKPKLLQQSRISKYEVKFGRGLY